MSAKVKVDCRTLCIPCHRNTDTWGARLADLTIYFYTIESN